MLLLMPVLVVRGVLVRGGTRKLLHVRQSAAWRPLRQWGPSNDTDLGAVNQSCRMCPREHSAMRGGASDLLRTGRPPCAYFWLRPLTRQAASQNPALHPTLPHGAHQVAGLQAGRQRLLLAQAPGAASRTLPPPCTLPCGAHQVAGLQAGRQRLLLAQALGAAGRVAGALRQPVRGAEHAGRGRGRVRHAAVAARRERGHRAWKPARRAGRALGRKLDARQPVFCHTARHSVPVAGTPSRLHSLRKAPGR
jgi:hypothetical protein